MAVNLLLQNQILGRNLLTRSHRVKYFKWLSRNERLTATTLVNNYQQRRNFELQEYQSKQILHEHGVQVQAFKVVSNIEEAERVLFPQEYQESLETSESNSSDQTKSLIKSRWSGFDSDISQSDEYVIKAQVLAGGRGRGRFIRTGLSGGVQLTTEKREALRFAKLMLQDHIVTKQTKSDGVLVEKVMIAEAVRLTREFYFAIVLDRSYDFGPIFVASPTGGMDIEDVAEKDPSAIRRFTMPIDTELDFDTARRISMAAFDLNMQDIDLIDQCAREIIRLHSMFLKLDATQVEINPLGVTEANKVICVDAKIKFDENARFRHKWLDELETMNQTDIDSRDFKAKKHNLNFIGLDGTIGCLVNGAGLAMATMDIIKLYGGQPANFLDVGGGATAQQVIEAFKIITSDKRVETIFVNIFGGIMRCDTIAQGIVEAARVVDITKPIVCRLQGTNMNEAHRVIEESQLPIIMLNDLDEAAQQAVTISRSA